MRASSSQMDIEQSGGGTSMNTPFASSPEMETSEKPYWRKRIVEYRIEPNEVEKLLGLFESTVESEICVDCKKSKQFNEIDILGASFTRKKVTPKKK